MKEQTFTAVELFAGAGGMALGTEAAGFAHLALLELDRHAVETLAHNAGSGVGVSPELHPEITDVTLFDYSKIGGPVDLLAGGAPCQPFSLGGKHAGQHDPRNLFPEVFRAQRALKPKAVFLENVRGLARKSFRPFLEYLLLHLALPGLPVREDEGWRDHKKRLLEALGRNEHGDRPAYHVTVGFRECADFGLPQKRYRVFIVGIQNEVSRPMELPTGRHSRERLLFDKYMSGDYWSKHGLRADRPNGQTAPSSFPSSPPWRTVRDAVSHLPPPIMWRANGHHPNHVGIPGARSYPGHTGSPWDEPAKTLKAGVHGVPGGENMLREKDGSVRYFTVHEASILQGFPPEYEFLGSRSEAMRQIGNAAPTPVCEAIANAIRDHLQAATGGGSPNGNPPHVDLLDGRQLGLL